MTDAPSVQASRTCAAQRAALAIERYAPCSVSEAVTAFAREVVGAAGPERPARAKALLFAAARIAAFGERVGLGLAAEALLCEAVIERFIACATQGFSSATRRTLRTNLRALARALCVHPQPLPTPLPRERAKTPYSPAEIDGYLRLAAAQSTEARRMRATALICLGAGAGIVSGELCWLRGCDVVARSGGLVVEVAGNRARTVPVLARLQEPLIAAAAFAGEGLIVGGRDPERRNLSDALCRALCADPSLPRLQAGRLRSTWLHQAAQTIGLQAFMAAAGVSCSQRLGDIAACLPVLGEQEMVALLGGAS
jgi:integrase